MLCPPPSDIWDAIEGDLSMSRVVDPETAFGEPVSSEPRWWSLCSGLDATVSRAMTGRYPPLGRMGGKRGVADGVLDILGTWPERWVMIDSDPAIILWWSAVFGGWLAAVAEVIGNASLDGEELWKTWAADPVPDNGVEKLARWIVVQKGNFSSKPVTVDGQEESWVGLAGYGTESGFAFAKSRVIVSAIASAISRWALVQDKPGLALLLNLDACSPVVQPGDLVTIDPPYARTTGYRHGLHRDRVVELATEADARGARVLVHEAEPVVEGGPWRSVELRRTYGGRQRTWSRQLREVATINFKPGTAYQGASRDRLASRRIMAPIKGPLFGTDKEGIGC